MAFDPISEVAEAVKGVADDVSSTLNAGTVEKEDLAQDKEESYKTEVDDRKSARTINSDFVNILAIIIILISLGVLGYALFHGFDSQMPEMEQGMIIQFFISAPTMIFAYYFGSSAGSQAKNDIMSMAMKLKK